VNTFFTNEISTFWITVTRTTLTPCTTSLATKTSAELNIDPLLANTFRAAFLLLFKDASAALAVRAPITAAELITALSPMIMDICPMAINIKITRGATNTNPTMLEPASLLLGLGNTSQGSSQNGS
jgi:hypothetical protein